MSGSSWQHRRRLSTSSGVLELLEWPHSGAFSRKLSDLRWFPIYEVRVEFFPSGQTRCWVVITLAVTRLIDSR